MAEIFLASIIGFFSLILGLIVGGPLFLLVTAPIELVGRITLAVLLLPIFFSLGFSIYLLISEGMSAFSSELVGMMSGLTIGITISWYLILKEDED